MERRLLQLRSTVVDFRPGFWRREGELVWSYSHGRSVLGVDGGDTFVQVARGVVIRSRKTSSSPEKWSGVFGKWVESNVVDQRQNENCYHLD